jgi:hypothetical protein
LRSDSNNHLIFWRVEAGSQSGNAIVEFAIVIPIILGMFLATVEFTRMFRAKEMMALASREAAHIAFRECFESKRSLCNVGGSVDKIDACLDYFSGAIVATVENSLPGVELTVSLYAMDGADPLDPTLGTIERIGITHKQSNPPQIGQGTPSDSRFEEPDVNANYRDIMRTHQVMVFAEVFYKYPALIDYQGSWSWVPKIEMYDVTVF